MTRDYKGEAAAFGDFLIADESKGPRRRVGDKVTGRCPLPEHEDRSPSFGYDVAKDASACSCAEATGKGSALRARLGWTWTGAPSGGGTGEASKRRKSPGSCYGTLDDAALALSKRIGGAEAGRWQYLTPEGVAAFAVFRFNLTKTANDGKPFTSKEYRPVRRDPDGWRIGDPPAPLPLFQLSTLGKARLVVYVEGEKCAEAVAAVGFTVTTSAHGAKAADKTDFAPLAGRDVRILPDNDKPGEALALTVADLLAKLSPPARPRIVRLPGLTGLGDGADVADWIAWRRKTGSSDEGIFGELTALFEAGGELAPVKISGPRVPKLRTRRAADVKIRPLVWLWPGRLPAAMPSVIFGDPGKGKSAFTVDFVSRLTTGRDWPDGAPNGLPPCSALVINCEDHPEVVLVPRLKLAGADLDKVHLFDALEDEKGKLLPFSLGYFAPVEEYLASNTDIRVVVLDPWGAYLGGKEGNDNGAVRGLIAPFAELCERRNVALLVIAHPNKDPKQTAMYRLGGSLGLIAACRAAFVVAPDPENAERRFFLAVKSNVGALPPGLAFRVDVAEVEGAGTVARIEWEPDPLPPQITADSVMTMATDSPERRTEKDEARDWLREALAEGPKPSKEVLRDAHAAGIPNKALRAVAKALGVSTPREGYGTGARYVWKLPASSKPPCVPHAFHAFPVPEAGTHGTHEGKHGPGEGSNGVLILPDGRERAEI